MKTLYYGGDFITMENEDERVTGLLVEDGKIIGMGRYESFLDEENLLLYNLNGKTLIPGFIDGHSHITNQLNTYPNVAPELNITTIPDLISALKKAFLEKGANAGEYFIAIGYDESYYPDKRPPTRHDLNQISTEVPIIVFHKSLHLAAANNKALEKAQIDASTKNPDGGIIQREKDGTPNGVFEEKAVDLLGDFLFGLVGDPKDLVSGFYETQKYYASFGITTAQDGGSSEKYLELLKESAKANKMLLDIYAYPLLDGNASALEEGASKDKVYKNHIKILGGKVVADGSPQAKTAWLTKPYFIPPENEASDYRGYPLYTDEQMEGFIKTALEKNQQILCHCNGDAMGDQFLRTYKKVYQSLGEPKDIRPVMIHAQTVREDQLEEMASLNMMASFFHDHVYYWGEHHKNSSLGEERARRISPLKSALEKGVRFTLHQDTPIVAPNMILSVHNAVNRLTNLGNPLGSEFAIDVYEALKAVTINAAYQAFDEAIKGSLKVGKLADFVILDKNPLKTKKEQLKDIKIIATIKENRIIYKNPL